MFVFRTGQPGRLGKRVIERGGCGRARARGAVPPPVPIAGDTVTGGRGYES